MPRRCLVCSHGERERIDAELAGGAPLRRLSALYRVSEDSLARHRDTHLPRTVREAQAKEDARSALNVLEQLKAANTAAWQVLVDARKEGKGGLVLAALDRVQRHIELQAKLLGELDDTPRVEVNVLISDEWVAIRTAMMRALEPYVQARVAVAEALMELEGGGGRSK